MKQIGESFEEESRILKTLAHPARLAILELLRNGDHCVCHMEAALGYRQAYISQHLMLLRDAGLVSVRREGWNIYYHVIKPEVFEIIDKVYQLTNRDVDHTEHFEMIETCTCPRCQVVKHPNH
ncbi:MAG: ArsR/SmtB family transcription factor [Anaerolineales bacterium]